MDPLVTHEDPYPGRVEYQLLLNRPVELHQDVKLGQPLVVTEVHDLHVPLQQPGALPELLRGLLAGSVHELLDADPALPQQRLRELLLERLRAYPLYSDYVVRGVALDDLPVDEVLRAAPELLPDLLLREQLLRLGIVELHPLAVVH